MDSCFFLVSSNGVAIARNNDDMEDDNAIKIDYRKSQVRRIILINRTLAQRRQTKIIRREESLNDFGFRSVFFSMRFYSSETEKFQGIFCWFSVRSFVRSFVIVIKRTNDVMRL